MPKFFVSCPLNFEKELAAELREFWFEMIDLDGQPTRADFPELLVIKGGLEFETEAHLGYQINFFSKIANRVLLRLKSFEARYFDQFEKQMGQIEWSPFFDLKTQPQLRLKIESHKSRLNNEKNLSEAASRALNKSGFKMTENESAQSLFIRIEKDRVGLSLDTSGEHLHRRGYAEYRGEAPMRETLAAFMVRRLKNYLEEQNNSDQVVILDPFLGSGTLAFEALSQSWPNFDRHYSFLNFIKVPKIFQSSSWKKNYRWLQNQKGFFCQAMGLEIDEKTFKSFEKNSDIFFNVFAEYSSREQIKLESQLVDSAKFDLNSWKKGLPQNSKLWILTNPPYGVRLHDEKTREILQRFEDDIEGVLLVHPLNWKFSFSTLSLKHSEPFSNQGLELKLSIFSKP